MTATILVNADTLKIPLADKSVDLILTSPPYDNLRNYNGYVFDFNPIAIELYRVLKTGGVLVWVVGDSTDDTGESGTSFRQVLQFKSIGFRLHDTMIYMKSGPAFPSRDKYYQVFEYMFVLSKGKPKTINLLKDRKNRWFGQKWSKIRSRRQVDGSLKVQDWYSEEGEQYGVRFNVWQYHVGYGYSGDAYCHEHPASFPEALARDHIETWSNPGDIILDPMCGSGTTCKMAMQTGRLAIGTDISIDYIKLSQRRLLAANIPLPLFTQS